MTRQSQVADEDSKRESILDALERCIARFGVAKTNVSDVAYEAGVSRVTIYRYFEGKEDLFRACIIRNLTQQWQDIADQLSDIEDLSEWLVEAVLLTIRRGSNDPLFQMYKKIGAFEQSIALALDDSGRATAAPHIEPLYEQAIRARRIPEGISIDDLIEWLYWMTFILATGRSPRMKDEVVLRRWLYSQVNGGLVRLS